MCSGRGCVRAGLGEVKGGARGPLRVIVRAPPLPHHPHAHHLQGHGAEAAHVCGEPSVDGARGHRDGGGGGGGGGGAGRLRRGRRHLEPGNHGHGGARGRVVGGWEVGACVRAGRAGGVWAGVVDGRGGRGGWAAAGSCAHAHARLWRQQQRGRSPPPPTHTRPPPSPPPPHPRTRTQLALGEPPRLSISPLRLLFLIVKEDPPQLEGAYSTELKDFVWQCLRKVSAFVCVGGVRARCCESTHAALTPAPAPTPTHPPTPPGPPLLHTASRTRRSAPLR